LIRLTGGIMKKRTLFELVDRDSLEFVPMITALHDTQNNIIWANRLYREATGRSLSEIEGKKCYSVWGLEKPCRNCPVIKALETGEAAEAELTPGNQDHWPDSLGSWLSKAQPFRDDDGNIIGAIEVAIDITAGKKTEEELLQQRAMMTRTESISHVGSWEWDISRDHVNWSEELFRIFGLDPAEGALSFTEQSKIYKPEDMKRLREAVEACQSEGTPYEFEVQIIRSDGERRYCINSGLAEIESGGQINRLVGSLQDITERRQIEETLRESDSKYRNLFEAASDAIYLIALDDGSMVEANSVACRMLGRTKEEILGLSIEDIDPNYPLEEFIKFWKDRPEEQPLIVESSHKRRDGTMFPVEISGIKYRIGDQVVLYGRAHDITERKKVEEGLLQQRAMMARTESISHVGSWEWDISPDQVSWSDEMFNITGLDPAEGAPSFAEHSRVYLPEDMQRLREVVEACMAEKTPYKIELRAIRASGEIRYCLASGRAEIGPDGKVCRLVGFLQDITDRRQAEEESARLESQLKQAQRMESVGRLAGGVAHDFNNMLSVILGYTEMAREQVSPDQPLYANLEEILTAAKRSRDITRQLLAFARKQTISPVVLDINEIMSGMINFLKRLIGEDIELDLHPEANLWPVMMDPSQIDQILINLCVNSRDAIGGVGKIILNTGNVTLDEMYSASNPGFVSGEFVQITVSDDGCGMDKEIMDNVFEPFFTTKDMAVSTGLGLATVYGIVKQNSGQINVYSDPGKGTCFKLYFPRHKGNTGMKDVGGEEKIQGGCDETILLVEDEDAIMKMAAIMLEKLDYQVLVADSAEKGLTLAAGCPGGIDLLITDVVLPGMNGRDLAKKVVGLYPDIKILFMSGYTADVIADRGVIDDSVNFIQKPFSLQDLAVKTRSALDQK
jgi:PAS domain S-box-containing protein